jgi:hypothetical protein
LLAIRATQSAAGRMGTLHAPHMTRPRLKRSQAGGWLLRYVLFLGSPSAWQWTWRTVIPRRTRYVGGLHSTCTSPSTRVTDSKDASWHRMAPVTCAWLELAGAGARYEQASCLMQVPVRFVHRSSPVLDAMHVLLCRSLSCIFSVPHRHRGCITQYIRTCVCPSRSIFAVAAHGQLWLAKWHTVIDRAA